MKPYYDKDGITIYCGDWRDMTPPSCDLVLADPPYGDDHDTDYTRFTGGKKRVNGESHPRYQYAPVANDSEPFDPRPLLKIGKAQILWGANRYSNLLPIGSLFVWDKRPAGGSKGVMSDAEVAWHSRGCGVYIFEHTWDGFNRASELQSNLHPTQKPVALMVWCLQRAKLKPGALVFDPYMGSGPVAAACKQLGYRYVGCELVEQYCAAAVERVTTDFKEAKQVDSFVADLPMFAPLGAAD